MKRGPLTLMIAGIALALAIPGVSAVSAPNTGNDGFRVALDDGQPNAAPSEAPPRMPPGGPDAMAHGWHHDGDQGAEQGSGHHCQMAEAHQAAMLAYAEVRLGLTEAQKPAWAKFVAAVKAAHEPQAKLCADLAGKPHPTTLPEHVARAEQLAAAHLAWLQAIRPALDALYPQLTPEQQKLATTLARHMHGGGHGDHEHGEHHHHDAD
jgi:hypothetical protein